MVGRGCAREYFVERIRSHYRSRIYDSIQKVDWVKRSDGSVDMLKLDLSDQVRGCSIAPTNAIRLGSANVLA